MRYRTIPDKEMGGYFIVNQDSFGPQYQCTSSLLDNELKIVSLEAEDCPKEKYKICIFLIGEASFICNHIANYPCLIEGKIDVKKLWCKHGDSLIIRNVKLLSVENCPENKSNCINCKHVNNVVIPSDQILNKSHAHVVCGKKKE